MKHMKYSIGDVVTPTEEIIHKHSLDNLKGRWGLVSKVEFYHYWIFFPEEPYPIEGGKNLDAEALSWIFFETEITPWEG